MSMFEKLLFLQSLFPCDTWCIRHVVASTFDSGRVLQMPKHSVMEHKAIELLGSDNVAGITGYYDAELSTCMYESTPRIVAVIYKRDVNPVATEKLVDWLVSETAWI